MMAESWSIERKIHSLLYLQCTYTLYIGYLLLISPLNLNYILYKLWSSQKSNDLAGNDVRDKQRDRSIYILLFKHSISNFLGIDILMWTLRYFCFYNDLHFDWHFYYLICLLLPDVDLDIKYMYSLFYVLDYLYCTFIILNFILIYW